MKMKVQDGLGDERRRRRRRRTSRDPRGARPSRQARSGSHTRKTAPGSTARAPAPPRFRPLKAPRPPARFVGARTGSRQAGGPPPPAFSPSVPPSAGRQTASEDPCAPEQRRGRGEAAEHGRAVGPPAQLLLRREQGARMGGDARMRGPRMRGAAVGPSASCGDGTFGWRAAGEGRGRGRGRGNYGGQEGGGLESGGSAHCKRHHAKSTSFGVLAALAARRWVRIVVTRWRQPAVPSQTMGVHRPHPLRGSCPRPIRPDIRPRPVASGT